MLRFWQLGELACGLVIAHWCPRIPTTHHEQVASLHKMMDTILHGVTRTIANYVVFSALKLRQPLHVFLHNTLTT